MAFLGGSSTKVTARNDDTRRSIQSAAALAIGVGAEYVSALGLYAYDTDGRCAARHEPDATARALRNQSVVLAVRLITTAQLAAAARLPDVDGLGERVRARAPLARPSMVPRPNHRVDAVAAIDTKTQRKAAAYALDERCAAPFPDDVSGDLAALRLWARARGQAAKRGLDGDDDTMVRPLALTLLATHGVQEFGSADEVRVRAALDGHLAQKAAKRDKARAVAQAPKKAAKIELEIVEPVADGSASCRTTGTRPRRRSSRPSRRRRASARSCSPAPCGGRAPGETMRDQACPPRVLAVSRDGAAILSND